MSLLPQVGQVVDDVFRVDAELDHGNFGAVYRVHDLLEGRTLALKVLKPGPHDEQELRQRFEREARLVYSLRHPHVLRVYYYGQTDRGLPYMAMEFLEGTDLRTLLRHHGPLSARLIQRIAVETLSALAAAHDVDIIHRDLKPANIYLVNDGGAGHVKVLDFGFAKTLDGGDSQPDLTAAKTLVGTPAYMSPELVHKKNVGPPADIYALGLIMAEMLTGQKIVQIESVYETIMFQASDKPLRMPQKVGESIFAGVIARAVEKDLGRRYQSCREMMADLEQLGQQIGRQRRRSSAHFPAQQPQAHALPSLQRSALNPASDDAVTQTNPRPEIDPFADFPAYEVDASSAQAASADELSTTRRKSYEMIDPEQPSELRVSGSYIEPMRGKPPSAYAQEEATGYLDELAALDQGDSFNSPAEYDEQAPLHAAPAQRREHVSSQRLPALSRASSDQQPLRQPTGSHQALNRPLDELEYLDTDYQSGDSQAQNFEEPSWASQALEVDLSAERSHPTAGFEQQLPPENSAYNPDASQHSGSEPPTNLLREVFIGILIGGLILGLFLVALHFLE